MNIMDFVSETLTQITLGIREAQARTLGTGVCISPRIYNKLVSSNECVEHNYASHVEFDIVVEVSEKKDANGEKGIKGGINVANVLSVSFGDSSKSGEVNTNKNVSRIKFEIPVCWPLQRFVDGWHKEQTTSFKQEIKDNRYDPFNGLGE